MIIENDRLEILHSNKELYPNIKSYTGIEDNLNTIEIALIQNKAEYYMIRFFQKLHQSMEKLHKPDNDEAYLEYLDGLATYIKSDWIWWRNNLKINTLNELDNLIHILKLSHILIEEATTTQDTELLFEAYYQVKSRLQKQNLLTNHQNKIEGWGWGRYWEE